MISKCQLVIIACHESDEKGRSKNEVMIGSSLKTKNSQHFNFSMWNILNRPNELNTNKKKLRIFICLNPFLLGGAQQGFSQSTNGRNYEDKFLSHMGLLNTVLKEGKMQPYPPAAGGS